MLKFPEFPLIHCSQHNEIVDRLIQIISIHEHNDREYRKEIERLKGIVAELQKAPKKPVIVPASPNKQKNTKKKKRSKGPPHPKATRLPIQREEVIKLKSIPEGAIFMGYRKYFVQEIQLTPQNLLFKLERWKSKEGIYHTAHLPEEYCGYHFGPILRAFINHQYHLARVTRPRLLEQLRDWGIEISKTELNKIILNHREAASEEMLAVLKTALKYASYIQTDDTGGRDQGKNKICTQIGNLFFTFLKTTDSKSRINFLELLNIGGSYQLNERSVAYLRQHGSKKLMSQVERIGSICLADKKDFIEFLNAQKIEGEMNQRLVMEAALIGALTSTVREGFVIVSDGAKQFAIMDHAMCWVHAIRLLEEQYCAIPTIQIKINAVLKRIRFLYHHLKRYQANPKEYQKARLDHYFDLICDSITPSESFNQALRRFQTNKIDLLRSLEKPEIPLHNNLSENDLREYVVRRKISGSTRSDAGRMARDAFCSLVKTCKKLGISFWNWIEDREYNKRRIPPLETLLEQKLRFG